MDELIARLEKATKPSRRMDEEIYRAVINEFAPSFKEYVGMVWETDRGQTVKPYTSSIDAALTLVPDRHFWAVRGGVDDIGAPRGTEGMFSAGCWPEPYSYQWNIWAKHPAIALCIAALKARQTINKSQTATDRTS